MSELPEPPRSVGSYREAIYRYVRGIVREPAVAEDLTQETLLRGHRELSNLVDPQRLSSWLYRIATNLCRDRFRAASYRHLPRSLDAETDDERGVSLADRIADSTPRLDKVMEQQEMSACVQVYLTELSDDHRAVMLLHDVSGLTNPEIAEMLGVTLATVKIRLHRARAKLREVLDEACSFATDERGVLVCEPKPQEPER